jgi:FNIP Repeat
MFQYIFYEINCWEMFYFKVFSSLLCSLLSSLLFSLFSFLFSMLTYLYRIPYGEKMVGIHLKKQSHILLTQFLFQQHNWLLSCTTLTFSMILTQPPTTIFHLIWQKCIKSINKLPSTLTHLKVDYAFNQPVDKLPPTLTYFTTREKFNQSVDLLSNKVTHFTTRYEFNQPVNNLPPTLTHLILGSDFNQLVNNFPLTLTSS